MKKLCAPGTVDAKEAFENKLREDKTKKFFESIKHVKPVYSARQWEDDYKKQVRRSSKSMSPLSFFLPLRWYHTAVQSKVHETGQVSPTKGLRRPIQTR